MPRAVAEARAADGIDSEAAESSTGPSLGGEWVTARIRPDLLKEVLDTITLAHDLSARDASLVSFLFDELADAIDAPGGQGVDPTVVIT